MDQMEMALIFVLPVVPSILYNAQMYLCVFSARGQNRELPHLTSAHGLYTVYAQEHPWFDLDMICYSYGVFHRVCCDGSL